MADAAHIERGTGKPLGGGPKVTPEAQGDENT